MPLTRRSVLAGTAAVALVPGAAWAQVEPGAAPTLAQFRAASARLLGADAGDLDPETATRILVALVSLGYGPGVIALADDTTVTGGVVADEIVAAWYSGVAAAATGPELVLFTDARMWTALDYTKPFGFCGGETGYWAEAPES